MMAQFCQKLTMGRRIAMFGCVVLPLSVAACQVFQDDISLISLSVGASMILLFVVVTSAQNRELAVSERTKEQIRQRLEIATVLNSCVGKLNSDTDIDVGINNLLATVNGYFQADRTYVFEIDPDRDVLINTFESICGQEVSARWTICRRCLFRSSRSGCRTSGRAVPIICPIWSRSGASPATRC